MNIENLKNTKDEDGGAPEREVKMDKNDKNRVLKGVGRKRRAHQRKSGFCHFGVIGKAIFSFLIFAGSLGVIGFGVVWILDNEKKLDFLEEDRPAMSEVVRNVDEKMIVTEEPPKTTNETASLSESESNLVDSEKNNPAKVPVLALNAGGSAGSAGRAADILMKEGYTLAKAGNASVFTYKDITVYYNEDSAKVDAEAVAEVLKKSYSMVDVKKATSTDEKKEKIVVMVGA